MIALNYIKIQIETILNSLCQRSNTVPLSDLFLFLNKIVEGKIGNDYEHSFINLIFYFDDYLKFV